VVVGKKAVGIVTHRRPCASELKLDAPVSSVMTPQERLVTVREDAPKEEVLALLHQHRIEKLLVVNAAHELGRHDHREGFPEGQPSSRRGRQGRYRPGCGVGAAVGTTPDTMDRVAAYAKRASISWCGHRARTFQRACSDTVKRVKRSGRLPADRRQ